jgi:hypothetical protein
MPGIFSTTNKLKGGYVHLPALGKAATSAFAERIVRHQEELAADESERLQNVFDGNSFLWATLGNQRAQASSDCFPA